MLSKISGIINKTIKFFGKKSAIIPKKDPIFFSIQKKIIYIFGKLKLATRFQKGFGAFSTFTFAHLEQHGDA